MRKTIERQESHGLPGMLVTESYQEELHDHSSAVIILSKFVGVYLDAQPYSDDIIHKLLAPDRLSTDPNILKKYSTK